MARGSFDRLHFDGINHRTSFGFTLLEMLIAITVMVVLAAAAAPSFSSLIESNKVKRLATEIEWLLVQAKSEAVMRNIKLSVHYVRDDANETAYQTDGAWVLAVTDSATSPANITLAKADAIAMIDGKDFEHIAIKAKSTFVAHTIDPVRATTNEKGSYVFYEDPAKAVKVIMDQRTGRVRVCGETGAYYNYEKCN
ncbi:pilus assembly FimT family protein [Photobacterium nomapromontoriensis]|uniref:pilus assembly FimT family protein n=1 Tax=Photobacterium nomapromontoriensis TaxID=2910237 RepID=UPI003D0B2BC1